MPVDRCVCRKIAFSELLQLAQEIGSDFDALARQTQCGSACGMCVPYIQLMLRTGRTSLPVMRPEDIKRMLQTASVA
jgi:bacterioferritin-associated ferredoxin